MPCGQHTRSGQHTAQRALTRGCAHAKRWLGECWLSVCWLGASWLAGCTLAVAVAVCGLVGWLSLPPPHDAQGPRSALRPTRSSQGLLGAHTCASAQSALTRARNERPKAALHAPIAGPRHAEHVL